MMMMTSKTKAKLIHRKTMAKAIQSLHPILKEDEAQVPSVETKVFASKDSTFLHLRVVKN